MTLCGVPDAEGTRVYVIELLGGRLCYREASAEEVSKMTSIAGIPEVENENKQ